MKITQLKEVKEAWPYFYDFCIKSKPYDFCSFASKTLRDNKIKASFEDFCSYSVYKAEKDGTLLGFSFIKEDECCLDVAFIFGIWRSVRSSKLIEATHAIFSEALKNSNKNYLKSEIRRTFKVKTYKKWIEKYDKTAIIFNDDNNTVVWCDRDAMKVTFKVIGANETTKPLMDEEFLLGETKRVKHGVVRKLSLKGKTYLFDEKGVDFYPDRVLVHGLLSDDEENVGRIAFEFIPKK